MLCLNRKVISAAIAAMLLSSSIIFVEFESNPFQDLANTYKLHNFQRKGIHLDRKLMLYGVELDLLKNRIYDQSEPLNYLKEYKNPCWIEHLPRNFMKLYQKTAYYQLYGKPFVNETSEAYKERQNSSDPWRLRCLPYVYIAGVTKSGTTDFFDVLLKHPNVYSPWVKEPMYWNRERYHGVTVHKNLKFGHTYFDQFVSNFDHAAHHINKSRGRTTNETTHQPIIIDGSSYLIWEDNGWPYNPGNRGLSEPLYTTAMALYAAQPQAKIIVLLREPAQRLYSAFIMYTGIKKDAPQRFHDAVQEAIKAYTNCSSHSSWRACFYDVSMYNRLFPVTLRASMYSIFLKDWLDVFPRNQVMVIKSEDYYSDRMLTMKEVLTFLDLDSFSVKLAGKLQDKGVSNNRKYWPMWNSTRQILNDFYKPFIKDLEILLKRKFWS